MTASTWPFCPSCYAILWIANREGLVVCDVCSFRSTLDEIEQSLPHQTMPCIVTQPDRIRPTPDWAKSDEEQAHIRSRATRTLATIAESCIKCNHPEVGYYTAQLRSVDEGQTVFYECPKCHHHWSTNN
jgi:DNA-directed RNA polymerase I subunit RPA12